MSRCAGSACSASPDVICSNIAKALSEGDVDPAAALKATSAQVHRWVSFEGSWAASWALPWPGHRCSVSPAALWLGCGRSKHTSSPTSGQISTGACPYLHPVMTLSPLPCKFRFRRVLSPLGLAVALVLPWFLHTHLGRIATSPFPGLRMPWPSQDLDGNRAD